MPRANFVCLSRKCQKENGEAMVYELPVSAKVCSVCGSKRIKRLFDAINIASGRARQLDAMVEGPVTAALAKKDELKRSRLAYPMVRAVPTGRIGHELGQVYGMGQGSPVAVDQGALRRKAELGGTIPGAPGAVMGDMRGAMPRSVVARDLEYQVVRGKDGPEIAKA